jgi:hypothetical protein
MRMLSLLGVWAQFENVNELGVQGRVQGFKFKV